MVKPDYMDIAYFMLLYFASALRGVIRSKKRILNTVIMIVVLIAIWANRYNYWFDPQEPFAYFGRTSSMIALTLISVLLWMAINGTLLRDRRIREGFVNAGFTNSKGIAPILKDCIRDRRMIKYVFISKGIPFEKWKNCQELIENVLDISIDTVCLGHSIQV